MARPVTLRSLRWRLTHLRRELDELEAAVRAGRSMLVWRALFDLRLLEERATATRLQPLARQRRAETVRA